MQGVKLMYLEGEVKSGCVTGRTVLVIETAHQIDPKAAPSSLKSLVDAALKEWEGRFQPVDLIRLEHRMGEENDIGDPPVSITSPRSRYANSSR